MLDDVLEIARRSIPPGPIRGLEAVLAAHDLMNDTPNESLALWALRSEQGRSVSASTRGKGGHWEWLATFERLIPLCVAGLLCRAQLVDYMKSVRCIS